MCVLPLAYSRGHPKSSRHRAITGQIACQLDSFNLDAMRPYLVLSIIFVQSSGNLQSLPDVVLESLHVYTFRSLCVIDRLGFCFLQSLCSGPEIIFIFHTRGFSKKSIIDFGKITSVINVIMEELPIISVWLRFSGCPDVLRNRDQ